MNRVNSYLPAVSHLFDRIVWIPFYLWVPVFIYTFKSIYQTVPCRLNSILCNILKLPYIWPRVDQLCWLMLTVSPLLAGEESAFPHQQRQSNGFFPSPSAGYHVLVFAVLMGRSLFSVPVKAGLPWLWWNFTPLWCHHGTEPAVSAEWWRCRQRETGSHRGGLTSVHCRSRRLSYWARRSGAFADVVSGTRLVQVGVLVQI